MVWWLVLASCAVAAWGKPQDSPQEVEIIKQINRVNEDGSYTFGYEAADGSFKIETRDVMGNVKGMFGFIDETGELKRVSYTANNGTGFKASGDGLPTYTTERPGEEEVTRRPVLVIRQPNDSTRPPPIQHIPRKFSFTSTTASTSTTPVYGDYVKGRRTHIVLPTRVKEETTTKTPKVTEEPEDEPTQIPLRKLLLPRKPAAAGKGGNNLRRQLGGEPDAPSGDVADVYSGGAANPRYIPVQSIRSPQSPLLANLPPHVAAAIRQQQIARAAASLRSYPPVDPYSTPSPLPDRPNVIDEQEYPPVPVRSRPPLPPVKALYRPSDEDLPSQVPFPMASLASLRDELMDYILRYLQYRLAGGNPYLPNPYSPPFQNPVPNFPYPNPTTYPGANPNLYNPYFYPTPPYQRGIYQPPFNPLGYPQVPPGYPGVGYPGNFPQPLPFSSPNKQQAGQGYGPSQRSAPTYEQITSSQRQIYEPKSQRGASQNYEQAETRGTSDQTTYSLPPTDVLRMMLARGLATTTTTAAPSPVRNVQILGAASSVSSSTLPPPEEMEMQA